MSVEHVTQRIINIRLVAVVAMGIYTPTTINPFHAKYFIIAKKNVKKK